MSELFRYFCASIGAERYGLILKMGVWIFVIYLVYVTSHIELEIWTFGILLIHPVSATMGRKSISIAEKLDITQKEIEAGNVGRNLQSTIKASALLVSSSAATNHKTLYKSQSKDYSLEKKCTSPKLENSIYSWVTNQRDSGFAVSTCNIICKVLQL